MTSLLNRVAIACLQRLFVQASLECGTEPAAAGNNVPLAILTASAANGNRVQNPITLMTVRTHPSDAMRMLGTVARFVHGPRDEYDCRSR